MTDVLLIDDDIALSGLLTQFLEVEGFRATAVFRGEEGIRAVAKGRFDVVILDIMLPDISGIEVLRRIRQSSQIPVIMLTAKGADVDRVVGLEMGADDYVPKPYYARELVARVRAVMRRQGRADSAGDPELGSGGLRMDVKRRKVEYGGTPLDLTVSEFDLLEALLKSSDVVATKDDLSQTVLGRPRRPFDRSVDVHVSHLRKKLSAISDGRVEIETVRGIGYRLRSLA